MRPQASSINPSVIAFSTIGFFLIAGILIAMIIASGNVGLSAVVFLLPFAVGVVVLVFINPYYGLMAYLNYSFFFLGLNRYFPGVALGLTVDAILFLTTIALFTKVKWSDLSKLHNGIFYVSFIWFLYTLLEIFNPEVTNLEALFMAVRGLSLYAIQVVPLTLIWMNSKEDFNNFVKLILGWAVVSSFWGMRQVLFGVDTAEYFWLEAGGKVTHIIDGRLRAFSFYSDAGQFGTTMAYAALMSLILALGPYDRVKRFWYFVIFMITYYGFSLSGSRGPLFVLISGGFFYLLLIRRFKILFIGLAIGMLAFSILKFTYIGQSNYSILRLRTALDPKEASLLVRLKNQNVLKGYLSKRAFGSGIGTTDTWAKRFYPGSVLAGLPTDSWFVNIWVQTGIIGLITHMLVIVYVLVIGYSKVNALRNDDLRQKLIAMYGGYFGVIVASFGNPIFGQAPIGAIMYVSMVYLCTADVLDDEFMAAESPPVKESELLNA